MTWFDWLLVVGFGLSAVGWAARVGLPRSPVSAGHAAFEVAFCVFLIVGVVSGW